MKITARTDDGLFIMAEMDQKEIQELAARRLAAATYGRMAFKAGKMRTPAGNRNIMELMTPLATREFTNISQIWTLMDDFTEAWDQANEENQQKEKQ